MMNLLNGFGFGGQQKNLSIKYKEFNIFYQNTRGLRSKLMLFRTSIETSSAEIFAVTETGCNESIHDSEIVPQGYTILRWDRADGRKQGGAFLVASHQFELRRAESPGNFNVDNCVFELVGAGVF
ncbi:hypothetical protein ACJJTC_005482 [Scirpophaga incertulas]